MQIRPTSNIKPTSGVQIQPPSTTSSTGSTTSVPVDQLEISVEAQQISAQGVSDVRADRIAEIRAQIAGGQYETTDKLDAAVGRLLNEIA